MSWTAALDYLNKYRTDRGKSLANEAPERWFASDVESLSELIDETFGRKEENAAWTKEYQAKGKVLKLEALQIKLAFLSGAVRDLRIMFASGQDNDPRTGTDHDRAEFMQYKFNLAKSSQLRDIIQSMEA